MITWRGYVKSELLTYSPYRRRFASNDNAYAIVQPSDAINAFIGKVNGLVGTFSYIAGSSNQGGTAPDGDTPVTPPDSGGGETPA